MDSPNPERSTSDTRERAAFRFYGPLADAPQAARRVGWESDAAHRARLNAIALTLGPLESLTTVLDAGCGEGALLPVLRAAGFTGRYVGVDILPHMIARAIAGNTDPNAVFEVRDAFSTAGDDPLIYDGVVCSGALNTVVADDPDGETCAALSSLWAQTDARLAVDFAVADRHAPGAGLARTDLLRAWHHARSMAPVVVVREDGVPGEAILQLSRTRGPALARWLPDDPRAQAALLLAGDEAGAAARLVAGDITAEGRFLAGCAALARRQLSDAEAAFRGLSAGSKEWADKAALQLASVLWLSGRKQASETLLYQLAATSDEARFHLVELLCARRKVDEATRVTEQITDAWIAREANALIHRLA